MELLKIDDGPKTVNIFKEIDSNDDNQLSRQEVEEYLKVVPKLSVIFLGLASSVLSFHKVDSVLSAVDHS